MPRVIGCSAPAGVMVYQTVRPVGTVAPSQVRLVGSPVWTVALLVSTAC